MMDETVTAAELSRRLGVSKTAIFKAKSAGRLKPTLDASGRELYDLGEAQRVFKVNTEQSVSRAAGKPPMAKGRMAPEQREARVAELKAQVFEMKKLLERQEIEGGWELVNNLVLEIAALYGHRGSNAVPNQEDAEISYFVRRFVLQEGIEMGDAFPRWLRVNFDFWNAWGENGVFKSSWLIDNLDSGQLAVLEAEGVCLVRNKQRHGAAGAPC